MIDRIEKDKGPGMIYNFNIGIGWASSGVEYAQTYRANILRKIGANAKFVFVDMFPQENIEHMTKNIGFLDSEIIWLYTFFTDTKIAPVSYTLEQLENSFEHKIIRVSRDGKIVKYFFSENGDFCTAYLVKEGSDLVHRVERVSNGCLIRKDYYTYCRIYSEYYAPLDNAAHLYQRRYFNEDESIAYEEIIDGDHVLYRFPDRILCSKAELIAYMVQSLKLTDRDIVIFDRETDMGHAILKNVGPAKVGVIIHADHFSEGSTDETNILWNNYYEYAFAQNKHIDFYVAATEEQRKLVIEQFEKYMNVTPTVFAIPVGSLNELKFPNGDRKKHSLITASRLASEKHIDWVIDAVVEARKVVPDITLDIYGKGVEEEKLKKQIEDLKCGDYIHMCGQHNLTEVYQSYDAYIAGSTSEGFGLTLMEAVGGGLPIVGFDVRYGNQTFIDNGRNGYLIPIDDKMSSKEKSDKLAESLIKMFTEDDMEAFHSRSYEVARKFLTIEVEKKWKQTIENLI